MSSNLYKKQYSKVIKIAKEAESSDDSNYDKMDLDLEAEMNLYLNNQNLLNTEVVCNNVPKSYDWIQYYLVFYSDSNNLQTSVELQLAISLNRLSTNSSLWTISTLFGICEATVLNFLNKVIIAFRSLRSEYIVWPSDNYRQEVNTGFEQIQGFPMVIGVIDGSHIPLYEAPSKDNKDVYMLCKQKYGIYLQGVVDHQGLFISYEIGWSASVHDAKVFSNSNIFKNYKNYFKEEDYLIADSAYPFFHGKTRVVVEQAFGHLKARFPFLKEIRVKDTKKASDIIDIALILHNFIEKHNNIWGNSNLNNNEIELEPNKDNELTKQIVEDNEPYRIEREYAKIKQQNLLEIILNYS
ncbi:77_t:CDS:2 [Gigaspora margarita]|uniref:77_t:CDS:1 n=1 Tax=Gigaspora margarita TaxID=4874 RepID=A0ABN7V1A1_GIGMA|nr:77_t:CDS:2 [Gigaspora margarita]